MFSDRDSNFLEMRIAGPDGQALHPVRYGLEKLQMANRDCRYGHRRAVCYFDQYSQVEPERVESFLKDHYPDNLYPIEVTYKVRGYSAQRGAIVDLVPLTKFAVDPSQHDPSLKAVTK